MKRKMDMLERAHGLLCNVPGEGGRTDPDEVEQWRKLRADWIDRYGHLIRDHATKHRNARTAIGNEAITEFKAKARSVPVIDVDASESRTWAPRTVPMPRPDR